MTNPAHLGVHVSCPALYIVALQVFSRIITDASAGTRGEMAYKHHDSCTRKQPLRCATRRYSTNLLFLRTFFFFFFLGSGSLLDTLIVRTAHSPPAKGKKKKGSQNKWHVSVHYFGAHALYVLLRLVPRASVTNIFQLNIMMRLSVLIKKKKRL